MGKKIYLISCNDGFKDSGDYDQYSDAVVVADSEAEAAQLGVRFYGWGETKNVDVEYIGEAKEGYIGTKHYSWQKDGPSGEVCASYHAG